MTAKLAVQAAGTCVSVQVFAKLFIASGWDATVSEHTLTATALVLVNFYRNRVSPATFTIFVCSFRFHLRRSLILLGQITSGMPSFLPFRWETTMNVEEAGIKIQVLHMVYRPLQGDRSRDREVE